MLLLTKYSPIMIALLWSYFYLSGCSFPWLKGIPNGPSWRIVHFSWLTRKKCSFLRLTCQKKIILTHQGAHFRGLHEPQLTLWKSAHFSCLKCKKCSFFAKWRFLMRIIILYFIVIISGAMGKQQTTKARTRKRNGWHGKRNEEQLLYLVLPRKFLDDSDDGAFHNDMPWSTFIVIRMRVW